MTLETIFYACNYPKRDNEIINFIKTAVAHILRFNCNLTFKHVAKLLNVVDHTTIIYRCNLHDDLIGTNHEYYKSIYEKVYKFRNEIIGKIINDEIEIIKTDNDLINEFIKVK